MNRMVRFGAVALALAAVACGSSVSSKQDAATAMHRVGQAGTSASSGADGTGGSPLWFDPLEVGQSVTVTGKSGTAKVTQQVSVGEGNTDVTQEIEFTDYSSDGENTFNGKLTQTVKTNVSGGGVESFIKQKGDLEMSGEYSSKLVFDITQKTSVGVGEGSVGVKVTFDGQVSADGEEYVFDNETIEVTASAD